MQAAEPKHKLMKQLPPRKAQTNFRNKNKRMTKRASPQIQCSAEQRSDKIVCQLKSVSGNNIITLHTIAEGGIFSGVLSGVLYNKDKGGSPTKKTGLRSIQEKQWIALLGHCNPRGKLQCRNCRGSQCRPQYSF